MKPHIFTIILLNIFVAIFYLVSIRNIDDSPTDKFFVNELSHSTIEAFQNNMDDLHQLIDLKNFRFTLKNFPCHESNFNDSSDLNAQNHYEKNIFLLIFIHSAVNNFYKRQVIRDTWGSLTDVSKRQIRKVFLVGSTEDPSSQSKLIVENNVHHDIIQGNFIDSYRNLTYKHVMGLKWVVYHCRTTKFILKTDDDIFVDLSQLVEYLRGYMNNSQPSTNLICCHLYKKPMVRRNTMDKWFVGTEEYPDKYYPPYCPGWSLIMSSDVVKNLYIESKNSTYFWIDDVFVTGILAQRLKLQHIDLKSKITFHPNDVRKWLVSDSLSLPPFLGHPKAIKNISTVYDLWNKTKVYHEKILKFER